MPEEINNKQETKQEETVKPDDVAKKIYDNDDDIENLTMVEKFARLEMETKTGLIITSSFFLALIFRWHWFNTRWWIVLILGAVGLKTLYTQMNDLTDEKPSEAKLARYSFVGLIALLVIRDLYITSYLADIMDYLPLK